MIAAKKGKTAKTEDLKQLEQEAQTSCVLEKHVIIFYFITFLLGKCCSIFWCLDQWYFVIIFINWSDRD